MKVRIRRDQAVWEREMFEVEVEDGLEGQELVDVLRDAVSDSRVPREGYYKEILDDISWVDDHTVATLPDDTELEI